MTLGRLGRHFRIAHAACAALLVALIALRVWDPPPLEELRLRTFDFYQIVRPRVPQQRPVVIVDIDEASLKELGQWPWPRTLLAEIVDRVTRSGALAIGFDIVFSEPDRMSPANAADLFRELDEETRKKLRLLPSNDEVFAEALRRSRVVVGQSGTSTRSADPEAEFMAQAGFASRGPDPTPYLVSFPYLLRNAPPLDEAAAGRGLLTIKPERDGVVRRIPLVMTAGGGLVPALTLEMLRVVSGSSAILIRTDEGGVSSVAVPGLEMPTDRNGRLWLHFARHDQARFVSAVDVLRNRQPPDRFDRRLVLVGTSAIGLLDLKTTPIDPAMPGVEVNAQILENILMNGPLSRPNYAIGAELFATLLLGLTTIAVAPILGAAAAFMLGLVNTALLTGASWYLYLNDNILIDYTFPVLATTLIFFVLVFANYFREEERRKKIRSAFSYYLSPTLVNELANNPDKLVLGGEERAMTILFSDVRGFTTISEHYKNDPQRLTSLMNRYLTPMTNAIIEHNGTVDKYIGDAIMAFWGAPLEDKAHEANACGAALEMLVRLRLLNLELKREADEAGLQHLPLRIGVGINTGRCVVGNMGSDFRFNYSVLGDSVNLASRLEGRSKDYGLPVVLGFNTATAIEKRFAAIEIDLIQVKGKNEPEAVFALLGDEEVLTSARFEKLKEVNAHMLKQYRAQDWSSAADSVALCSEAADGFGLDGLYQIYRQRLEHFRSNPPTPQWSGVFVYDSK